MSDSNDYFPVLVKCHIALERHSSGPSRDQEGTGGEGHLGNGLAPNNKSKSTSQLSAGTLQSETSNLTKVWWNDS